MAAVQLMLGLLKRERKGVIWKLKVITLQEAVETALLTNMPVRVEVQQQTLGWPEQVERDYTWHVLEHPSPPLVLPSSQPSQGKMTIPSPQTVEQSPFEYFGSVYPPQVQLVGQVKQRTPILVYPVWQTEQAEMFVHVWQPSIGQVEQVPTEVTPQPPLQTEQVAYPIQVAQLETEQVWQRLLGLMKQPLLELHVRHIRLPETYAADTLPTQLHMMHCDCTPEHAKHCPLTSIKLLSVVSQKQVLLTNTQLVAQERQTLELLGSQEQHRVLLQGQQLKSVVLRY